MFYKTGQGDIKIVSNNDNDGVSITITDNEFGKQAMANIPKALAGIIAMEILDLIGANYDKSSETT